MCTSYHVFPEENTEMHGIISELTENFPGQPVKTGRISPTDCVVVIDAQGIKPMRFGLQLPYRKGLQLNARSETAARSPLFSPMLISHRCLVPANAFYEWTPEKKAHLFSAADGGLLYMAALYTMEPQGPRFVILTRAADEQVCPIHDRMPLLLQSPEYRDAWLRSPILAKELMQLDGPVPLRRSST